MTVVVNALRTIFILLDSLVYGILEIMFNLIMDLANVEIFSPKAINEFSQRIYVILGIVMALRLMMSLIQVMIQPEKMNDKEQGAAGILKRVVISLVLIVTVRPMFKLARDAQNMLLPVIPNLLLGNPGGNLETGDEELSAEERLEEMRNSAGHFMAWYSFLPFVAYDGVDGEDGTKGECNDGSLYGIPSAGDVDSEDQIKSVFGMVPVITDRGCTSDSGYRYKYQFFISTLVGGYMVYIMISIAVAVAIRSIKLGICEIIAPIPIASYIDPKLSKQAFDNWVSTTLKVYADLFIRLIVVYFILFVFIVLFGNGSDSLLSQITGNVDNWFRASLVTIFIIVGLLQFAKDMPKFFTKMLGIPEGFGDIAGMFKGEGVKAIRDSAKLASNPVTVGAGNYISRWRQTKNAVDKNRNPLTRRERFRRAANSAIGGATSAALRGGTAILTGKDVGEAAKIGRERATQARRNREMDQAADVNMFNRMGVQMKDYAGVDSGVTFGEEQIKAADAMVGDISKFKSTMTSLYTKYADQVSVSSKSEGMKKVRDNVQKLTSNGSIFDIDSSDYKRLSKPLQKQLNVFKNKVESGTATYADLLSLREFAEKNSDQSISMANLARSLNDDSQTMRGIQKAMFEATLNGKLDSGNEVLSDALNIGLEGADDDMTNAYNQARQTYNANNTVLGLRAGNFEEEAKDMFGGLETKVKKVRQDARETIGKTGTGQQEAAARESIRRRKDNGQSSGS